MTLSAQVLNVLRCFDDSRGQVLVTGIEHADGR
jgi:hypothetical protein